MPYFGISTERYGGWTEEEKGEALERAELPPDREPREEASEDGNDGREPYPEDIEEGWPEDDKELPIEDAETDWKEPYSDDINADN